MTNRNLAQAIRLALLATGTTVSGLYGVAAYAQEAELEQVVVTGSRISRRPFGSVGRLDADRALVVECHREPDRAVGQRSVFAETGAPRARA